MSKPIHLAAAAVLLIALIVLSAYAFTDAKSQSVAATMVTSTPLPTEVYEPAPTTGATAMNQQPSSDAVAKAALKLAPRRAPGWASPE